MAYHERSVAVDMADLGSEELVCDVMGGFIKSPCFGCRYINEEKDKCLEYSDCKIRLLLSGRWGR